MVNIIECDGCGARMGEEMPYLGISGHSKDEDFQWCGECAEAAREVIAQRTGAQIPEVESRIREAMTEAQEHPGRIVTR